jgi:60 kDa SS-A/Ro ribonucleoprotein
LNFRETHQSEQADTRQVENSAGGFVFEVSEHTRLERFLTLGTDGGTYYVGEHKLALENAKLVIEYAKRDPETLVDTILKISQAGRAPKQNPGIFALAITAAYANEEGRHIAYLALPFVCRTGSTLFLFLKYLKQMRPLGGNGLKRAIASWYLSREPEDLAYQLLKYRQREGWTHRDVLRVAHPKTDLLQTKELFDWVTHPETAAITNVLVDAFIVAQSTTNVTTWVNLIERFPLSWEMLPDAALNDARVWTALIERGVPQTALMRQLPRLTKLGIFDSFGPIRDKVIAQLQDTDRLVKARVHPINVLVAARTYASGHSARGAGKWTPSPHVIDALDAAFYNAFGSVHKSGKRHLLALDVSSSMTWEEISGMPITPREASAALALVTMAVEDDTTVIGFTSGVEKVTRLDISPRRRLDDVISYIQSLHYGATDVALPALWAMREKQNFDAITIYTDNETWAGSVHPYQALTHYRNQYGKPVRQIVVGMTSTGFSVADPRDNLSLDVAGFDSAVPNLIADFSAGLI